MAERRVEALEVDPGAGVVAPPSVRFEALGVPTFRWYWITSWISSTGDGMENVIRNVLVVQLAGATAPFWLGMMVFAHWIPFTFFSCTEASSRTATTTGRFRSSRSSCS